MIYTRMVNKALAIAFDAHMGQLDQAGTPYVMHPLHMAEEMQDEASTIVALLHDTIEGSYLCIEDLRDEGFSEEILEAISLLTHDENTDYFEYILSLKANPLARTVKLAELRHNMDQTRFAGHNFPPSAEDTAHTLDRYQRAIDALL